MLSSLKQDIYSVPIPELGPEYWAPPSPELQRLMTPEYETPPPAPDTIADWLNRNQTTILVASAVLFGLVLVSRLGRR